MRNLKRVLSLAVASVMMIGMMVVGTGAAYADVDSQDNLEAIEVLQMVGLMEGDEKGNFNPDKNVTRNEMAVIMANLLNLNLGGTTPFTDVPAWAQDYVAACYNNGIVAGTSATTYSGDSSVTPAQAALMLLKACGYFQYQGEFENDWQMAVVKRGGQVDLFDDVSAAVTSAMSRNDVAQMVLNALETDMVMVTQEGGIQVDGNGMSVVVNPTYTYTKAKDLTGVDYNNSNDGVRQLCEDVYRNNLKKLADDEDDFGRPSTRWSYNRQSVTSPKAPVVTYTAAVKGSDIYVDLGRVNPDATQVVMDGHDVTQGGDIYDANFAIASGASKKIGGNGVLVEVYYDNDAVIGNNQTGSLATIVMINTYVSEVTDNEENDDSGYDIEVVGETKACDSAVAYEVEDVVLYTKTYTSAGTLSDYADLSGLTTDKLQSVELADSVTGEVTRVKDSDNFIMDGESYSYSKQFDSANVTDAQGKLAAGTVGFDATAYVDNYGYVIALTNVNASTDYAVVVDVRGGQDWSGTAVREVKLLFPDGNVQIVTVKKDDFTGGATPVAIGDIVTYTVNSSNVYDLTIRNASDTYDTTNMITTELKGETGKAGFTVAGTTYTANSKTEFFYYNTDDDEYQAWTGIKKYPGFDNNSTASYTYSIALSGNVVKAVYIVTAEDGDDLLDGSSKVASFFYKKGDEKRFTDSDLNDYYEVKAVIDGEIVTALVDTDEYANIATGGQLKSGIKTNDNGVITGTSAATAGLDANGDGYVVVSNAAVKAAKDDIITIANNGYAYADDVKVFEYDTDDSAFVTRRINSLRTTTGSQTYNVWAQVEDNMIVSLYYVQNW